MSQKIRIIGHLGKDPEVRFTKSGKKVASFSVAVSKKIGESKTTAWFKVSAWDKRADVAEKYLKKGSQVSVEGELMFDLQTGGPKMFDRQDGTRGTSFEVIAFELELLGKAEDRKSQVQEEEIDESELDDSWD